MPQQNTILVASSTSATQTQLRDILRYDYQILNAATLDDARQFLARDVGKISVILIDSSNDGPFVNSELAALIKLAHSLEISSMVLLDSPNVDNEILAYQYGANLVLSKPYISLTIFQQVRLLNELSCNRKNLKTAEGIQERAERDVLTGLYNREATRRRVNLLLSNPSAKPDTISALLMIDLDNFKMVNDTYGHLFGDEFLTRTAAKIRNRFRSNDIIGRIGGDEFIVYIDSIPNVELVEKRCTQLLEVLQETFSEEDANVHVSASIGVALVPEHGNTLTELYNKADQALYRAKKAGKNRFCIYSDNNTETIKSLVSNINTRIDSDVQPGMADNSLAEYVLKHLYETGDITDAINDILEEVGRQTNVSRVYIFENNADNTVSYNTFEWCNYGIEPQIDNLQEISFVEGPYKDWPSRYDENGVLYCPNIDALDKECHSHLYSQDIKSMLHCAILDNGQFRGFIGFDECVSDRIWTNKQVEILLYLSKILTIFLLKKRIQDETHMLSESLKSILDNQNAWIYVIDPHTFKLKYINQRTKNMSEEIEEDRLCYQVLMHRSSPCANCPAVNILNDLHKEVSLRNTYFGINAHVEASSIQWNGAEACLITCRRQESDGEPLPQVTN